MRALRDVLNFDQLKVLRELGLDIESHSSICFRYPDDKDWMLMAYTQRGDGEPTLSISDILNILPRVIESYGLAWYLQINHDKDGWFVHYTYIEDCWLEEPREEDINLIDALYRTLLRCIELGYIETAKK